MAAMSSSKRIHDFCPSDCSRKSASAERPNCPSSKHCKSSVGLAQFRSLSQWWATSKSLPRPWWNTRIRTTKLNFSQRSSRWVNGLSSRPFYWPFRHSFRRCSNNLRSSTPSNLQSVSWSGSLIKVLCFCRLLTSTGLTYWKWPQFKLASCSNLTSKIVSQSNNCSMSSRLIFSRLEKHWRPSFAGRSSA